MPWKECKPMDERLKFVARCLEGEKMAVLCREFRISRATGYKIFGSISIMYAWAADGCGEAGPRRRPPGHADEMEPSQKLSRDFVAMPR